MEPIFSLTGNLHGRKILGKSLGSLGSSLQCLTRLGQQGGFAVGFLSLIIPVYLAEFSPPSIRGRLVGFFDIFIQVGTLAGFWINYGIDATLPSNTFQWQLPVFVQFL